MHVVADLHCHSFWSDGVESPAQLMARGREAGLRAMALTDHDTLAGVTEGAEAASLLGMNFVAGVEFTVQFESKERHLLGYAFDPADRGMSELCARLQSWRLERHEAMKSELAARGLAIEARPHLPGASLGRVHLAIEFVRQGIVQDIQEAFQKHLSNLSCGGSPVSAEEAIAIINAAGGIAVVAHPVASGVMNDIARLIAMGVGGLEVWHPSQNRYESGRVSAIAQQYGLIKTGGSDYHGLGEEREGRIGRHGMPPAAWGKLEKRIAERSI